jgi:ABC-type uncharacterized transport system substrate-binding protein
MKTWRPAVLVIVLSFAVGGAVCAQPANVPVISWLPAASQNTILRACEHARGEAGPFQFDSWDLLGDENLLNEKIKLLQASKPPCVVVFGDYVSGRVAEQCPDTAQICLFNSMEKKCANAIYILSEPDPAVVWRAARGICPTLRRLGILFTEGYAPSAKLATQLDQAAGKEERVIKCTVPRGMCRTDSDFQKAVETLAQNGGCDLLYVPDDPNTSRFASTICAEARKYGIPVLGNDQMAGKGCVAALVRDLDEAGKLLCKAVSDQLGGAKGSAQTLTAPAKLKLDEAVLKTYPNLRATGAP